MLNNKVAVKTTTNERVTLMEIFSIVVTIGFVVISTTVSVSLIENAKINKTINELTRYTTSFDLYSMNRDNQLPGDSTVGDNNGRIEHVNINGVYEGIIAWKDMREFDYTEYDSNESNNKKFYETSLIANGNAPFIKAIKATVGIDYNSNINSNIIFLSKNLDTQDVIVHTENNKIYKNANIIPPVNINIAFGIDEKIDDGKPGSGKIVATNSRHYKCYKDGNYTISPIGIFVDKIHRCGILAKIGTDQ